MEKYIADRILEIQESFRKDPAYNQLWAEQETCNDRFSEVLSQVSADQRTTIEDYIGILIEIHLQTLIYAVT